MGAEVWDEDRQESQKAEEMRQPSISWLGSTGFLRARSSYYERMLNLFGKNIIAYWPLWDLAGATTAEDISGHGYNGAQVGTVTFGQAGMGDGRTACAFTNSGLINIYSAGFNGAFNGQEFSVLLWAQNTAGVWTDGQYRRYFEIVVDANNTLQILRDGSVNVLNDSILTLAQKSFGCDFIQACHWG